MPASQHQSGPLKQQNKVHKTGGHSSKRSVHRIAAGRVAKKRVAPKRSRRSLTRHERKLQKAQIRRLKQEKIAEERGSLGSYNSNPFLVAVVPLHEVDPHMFLDQLKKCHDAVTLKEDSKGHLHLTVENLKKRFCFVVCNRHEDLFGCMDVVKVADVVLLLYGDLKEAYDTQGDMLLSILMGQGMPSAVHVVPAYTSTDEKQFALKDFKKNGKLQIEERFPGEKIHYVKKDSDGLVLLQHIADVKKKVLNMRNTRSYILAENTEFVANDANDFEGTLKITGYLRGGNRLSVNRLVHIPGFGNFQIDRIEQQADPYNAKAARGFALMSSCPLKSDPLKRESLDSENVVDEMDAEQTFPTAEELQKAEIENKLVKKKVPKGTSEYQAAWILDDDSDGDGDGDSNDGDSNDDDAMDDASDSEDEFRDSHEYLNMQKVEDSDEDDVEWLDTQSEAMSVAADGAYDKNVDFKEDMEMLSKFRQQRQEQQFPDEVDTPQNMNARTRFQKFRGLKSFHSSPWDPKENLPLDYARIFQFKNFHRIRRRIQAAEPDESESVSPSSSYISVYLLNVPRRIAAAKCPIVLYSLYPNEQKMSLLNLAIARHHSFTLPVRSKDRLVFQVGFRRFTNCPIFSQHTMANKHKFERFLPNEGVCVASMFAPITLPPAPVLVFQDSSIEGLRLVATGAVLSADPDRCVIKRVVLSGHPFKINKRHAVIRYMFFNREDILWFKPVELRTKYGLRGHIREPLGTHGHMKCVFSQQMKSMDTVLMNLFKRVFPKWSYDPWVATKKFIETEPEISEVLDDTEMSP